MFNKKSQLNNGAIVWFSSRTLETAQLAQHLLPKTNPDQPENRLRKFVRILRLPSFCTSFAPRVPQCVQNRRVATSHCHTCMLKKQLPFSQCNPLLACCCLLLCSLCIKILVDNLHNFIANIFSAGGEAQGRAVCVWSGPLEPSRKMGGGGRSGREVQGWGTFTSGVCAWISRRVPAKKTRRWPVGNGPCICGIRRARRASCVCFGRGPSNHQGRRGEGGDPGVKCKGGGHSLRGVRAWISRRVPAKKTRRWPVGNGPCMCGISASPKGGLCVFGRGPLEPSRKMGGGGRSGCEVQGWGPGNFAGALAFCNVAS